MTDYTAAVNYAVLELVLFPEFSTEWIREVLDYRAGITHATDVQVDEMYELLEKRLAEIAEPLVSVIPDEGDRDWYQKRISALLGPNHTL